MSLYVEVMCDWLCGDTHPKNILRSICDSHAGNNPQGGSIGSARARAYAAGWKKIDGRDVCPPCAKYGKAPPPVPQPNREPNP